MPDLGELAVEACYSGFRKHCVRVHGLREDDPSDSQVGGTYPSINAALAAIGQIGPRTITVTGTCAESVSLFNARFILIIAPAPGAATIVGFQDSETFDIQQSHPVRIGELSGVLLE